MKIADLYVRVSTDEQADVGYSQRHQEEVLRKYCEKEDIEVRYVVYEDHSAKNFNRPEWVKLLMQLKKHRRQSDLVLFTKWDRFSRNAGDAYQMISLLRKLGVEPQAIEQPLDISIPENKMMLAFYLAAPEVENDRRALNVFHGMRRGRKEGRRMGRAPIGFVNKITEEGKKYICPKEPEAGIMKQVFDQILNKPFNVNQLYKDAVAQGLKVARGNFYVLLRNPVYCGRVPIAKHKDEESFHVSGQHEGIISESMWYEVQDILNGRKKVYSAKLEENVIMQLRGFLLCPRCDKNLCGSRSRGRTGNYYYYYHCTSRCGARFRTEVVNELFLAELRKLIPNPGMAEVYKEIINERYKNGFHAQLQEIQKVKMALEQNQRKLEKARELLLSGDIESSDFREIKANVERDIAILKAKLDGFSSKNIRMGAQLEKAIKNLSNIDTIYENATVREKREIIVSIYPEKITFDGFSFRNTRINEVVRLIFALNAASSDSKNEKTGKKAGLSCSVDP